jgi:hypothetical protein
VEKLISLFKKNFQFKKAYNKKFNELPYWKGKYKIFIFNFSLLVLTKDQLEKEIIYANLINNDIKSTKNNKYQQFLKTRINELAKEHSSRKINEAQKFNFIDFPSYDYRV